MIDVKVISLAVIALFAWAAVAAPEPAVSAESRIVAGTPITIEEFPYIVAFIFFHPEQGIYVQQCVGSLISSYHVLTTTFCFTDTNLNFVLVRAGSTNSMSGGILTTIREVIKHPLYVETPRENDIAVAVLNFPLAPSDTIQFLPLPPGNTDILSLKIVGWGFETEQGPQLKTLKTINMRSVPIWMCVNDVDEFPNSDGVIDSRIICAVHGPPVGLCLGDFGAPAMSQNDEIMGILSFYQDCGESSWPDVFTRVPSFTSWIMEVAVAPQASDLDATLASTAVPRIRV